MAREPRRAKEGQVIPPPKGNGAGEQQQQAPPQLFCLTPAQTMEQTDAQGNKLQVTLFHVMTPDGQIIVAQTVNGPQPLVIASHPVVIGQGLITAPTLLH